MKVVHWSTVVSGGGQTTYATHVSNCRWTDKARGRWSGRMIEDTGARVTLANSQWQIATDPERRQILDDLARSEAVRLGLPAGPDLFPYAT